MNAILYVNTLRAFAYLVILPGLSHNGCTGVHLAWTDECDLQAFQLPIRDEAFVAAHFFSTRKRMLLIVAVQEDHARVYPARVYPKWKIIFWELKMVEKKSNNLILLTHIDLCESFVAN